MYEALFDVGILERNEGKESTAVIDLFQQMGLEVSFMEHTRWLKIQAARQKRDLKHRLPQSRARRRLLKLTAVSTTSTRNKVAK